MVVGLSRFSNSTDPAGVLRAFGTLFRCTAPLPGRNCAGLAGGNTIIASVGLGPVGTGETVTLQASWDQVTKKVAYQKNAEALQSITYTQDDSRPPVINVKDLEVAGAPANCTAAPRPVTEITAFFDNVFYSP